MLRILSGYLSDSYFCSSLASLNIQADEGGVRTIAILYLICLFLFFFLLREYCAVPNCLEEPLSFQMNKFNLFFLSTSTTLPQKLQTGAADVFLCRQMSKA